MHKSPPTEPAAHIQPVRFMVEQGNVVIEAFVYGSGTRTLILAAGNGRPGQQLASLAADVASRGMCVVTYNYRGIGDSTGPMQGISLHDLAADVWAIADTLEAETVHLAGKTFGNRVMRAAACGQPNRVASIILIGAGGQIPPSEETRALYVQYLNPDIGQQEWSALNARLMYAPGNRYLAQGAAELGSFPDVARSQMNASNTTPSDEWAMGGAAPMLVIVGLDDCVAVPANGLELAAGRSQTWLVGLPDCGHNMIDEQPTQIANLLSDFVELHPSGDQKPADNLNTLRPASKP